MKINSNIFPRNIYNLESNFQKTTLGYTHVEFITLQ